MSSNPSTTPSGFTLFSKLPTEIRQAVWQCSLEPRVVEVSLCAGFGWRTRIANPPALQTCQDSRNTVIGLYPLCFGGVFHSPLTRFNFFLDTLYLGKEGAKCLPYFFDMLKQHELLGVQHLAIDCMIGGEEYAAYNNIMELLGNAVGAVVALKEFIIVVDVYGFLLPWVFEDLGKVEYSLADMELFDDIPEELQHPSFDIEPLAVVAGSAHDDFSKGPWPKHRVVYGWRRCPINHDLSKKKSIRDMIYDWEMAAIYTRQSSPQP